MSQCETYEMIFYIESGIIYYGLLSFHGLAISAAHFLVVCNHLQICKICCSSTYHRDLHLREYNYKIKKIKHLA